MEVERFSDECGALLLTSRVGRSCGEVRRV